MFQFKQNLPGQFNSFLVDVLDGCQVSLQDTESAVLAHVTVQSYVGGCCRAESHLVVSSLGVDLEVSLHGHQGAVVGSFLQRKKLRQSTISAKLFK